MEAEGGAREPGKIPSEWTETYFSATDNQCKMRDGKGQSGCRFSQQIHSEFGTSERAAPCSGTSRISAGASEEGFSQS